MGVMFTTRIKHIIIFKVIAAVVACIFTFTSIPCIEEAHALSPWAGSQRPDVVLSMLNRAFMSGKIDFADEGDPILDEEEAVLLPHGKILLSSNLRGEEDDRELMLKRLRVIFREEVRGVMQVFAKTERSKYSKIMNDLLSEEDILASYNRLLKSNSYSPLDLESLKVGENAEIIVNDCIARGFELWLLERDKAISKKDLSSEEKDFLHEVGSFIEKRLHNYFTGAFRDQYVREMNIRIALANGHEFRGFSRKKIEIIPKEVKETVLRTKESYRGIGSCKDHSVELVRRLTKAGIEAQVVRHTESIHFWVETLDHVIDAFPEGMKKENREVVSSGDEGRFIYLKKGSSLARKIYTGSPDRELTLEAKKLASDDVAYHQRRVDLFTRLIKMNERYLSIKRKQGADEEKDTLVLGFKDSIRKNSRRLRSAERKLEEAKRARVTFSGYRKKEFDEYLEEEGLKGYPALRKAFTPEAIDALLEDPALKPVFMQVIPEEHLGPLVVKGSEETPGADIRELLSSRSVFLAGSAEAAERLIKSGNRIMVGVTDKPSEDSLMPQNMVANGRTAYFPLSDGSWLGVKGSGQHNMDHEAPFFFRDQAGYPSRWEGLAWIQEAESAAKAEERFKDSGARHVKLLGYRRIKAAPDGKGNFQNITGLADERLGYDTPVIIFHRALTPHRLVKIGQILHKDRGLVRLTTQVSRTLVKNGLFSAERDLLPSEMVIMMMREFGRMEAVKQSLGLSKKTLHSQDLTFAGEEADFEEVCTRSELKGRMLPEAGNRGLSDLIELLVKHDLDVSGMRMKLDVLVDAEEISRNYSGWREDLLFRDPLKALKEFFTSYFSHLDDDSLDVWVLGDYAAEEMHGTDGYPLALHATVGGNDLSAFHPQFREADEKRDFSSFDNRAAHNEVLDRICSWAEEEKEKRENSRLPQVQDKGWKIPLTALFFMLSSVALGYEGDDIDFARNVSIKEAMMHLTYTIVKWLTIIGWTAGVLAAFFVVRNLSIKLKDNVLSVFSLQKLSGRAKADKYREKAKKARKIRIPSVFKLFEMMTRRGKVVESREISRVEERSEGIFSPKEEDNKAKKLVAAIAIALGAIALLIFFWANFYEVMDFFSNLFSSLERPSSGLFAASSLGMVGMAKSKEAPQENKKVSIYSKIISVAKFLALSVFASTLILCFKTQLPYTIWIGAITAIPLFAIAAYRLFKLKKENRKQAIGHNTLDTLTVLLIVLLFSRYNLFTSGHRLLFAHEIKYATSNITYTLFTGRNALIEDSGKKETVGKNVELWTIGEKPTYYIARIDLADPRVPCEVKVSEERLHNITRVRGAIAAVNGGYLPDFAKYRRSDFILRRRTPKGGNSKHAGLVKINGKEVSSFAHYMAETDRPIGDAIFGVKEDGTPVIRKVPVSKKKDPEIVRRIDIGIEETILYEVDEEKVGEITKDLKHALQLGPLLIWNGKVVTKRDDEASSWSFVGIAEDGSLIMGSEIASLGGSKDGRKHRDVAEQLKYWSDKNGIKLDKAVACDGGSFTDLYVMGDFKSDKLSNCNNSIWVVPKTIDVEAEEVEEVEEEDQTSKTPTAGVTSDILKKPRRSKLINLWLKLASLSFLAGMILSGKNEGEDERVSNIRRIQKGKRKATPLSAAGGTEENFSYEDSIRHAVGQESLEEEYSLLKIIQKYIDQSSRAVWVDVGPGYGLALREGKKLFGDKLVTYGVDPIDWAEEIGSEDIQKYKAMLGDDIFDEEYSYARVPQVMELASLPEEADIITFSRFLMYSNNPLKTIERFYNQLRVGGVLIVMESFFAASSEGADIKKLVIDSLRDQGVAARFVSGFNEVIYISRPDERKLYINVKLVRYDSFSEDTQMAIYTKRYEGKELTQLSEEKKKAAPRKKAAKKRSKKKKKDNTPVKDINELKKGQLVSVTRKLTSSGNVVFSREMIVDEVIPRKGMVSLRRHDLRNSGSRTYSYFGEQGSSYIEDEIVILKEPEAAKPEKKTKPRTKKTWTDFFGLFILGVTALCLTGCAPSATEGSIPWYGWVGIVAGAVFLIDKLTGFSYKRKLRMHQEEEESGHPLYEQDKETSKEPSYEKAIEGLLAKDVQRMFQSKALGEIKLSAEYSRRFVKFVKARAKAFRVSVPEYANAVIRGDHEKEALLFKNTYSKKHGNVIKAVEQKRNHLANEFDIEKDAERAIKEELKIILSLVKDKSLKIKVIGPGDNCEEIKLLLDQLRWILDEDLTSWKIHFDVYDIDMKVLDSARKVFRKRSSKYNLTWTLSYADVTSRDCDSYVYSQDNVSDITVQRNIPKSLFKTDQAQLDDSTNYLVLYTSLSLDRMARRRDPSDEWEKLTLEDDVRSGPGKPDTAMGISSAGKPGVNASGSSRGTYDLPEGLRVLSRKIEILLEEKERATAVITGKRGVGKTTISEFLEDGFAGIKKEEILIVHHDIFESLRRHEIDPQKAFDAQIKEYGEGKRLIVVEGIHAPPYLTRNAQLGEPDILVTVDTSDKLRISRSKLGGRFSVARLAATVSDFEEEPSPIGAGSKIVIKNNEDFKKIKKEVKKALSGEGSSSGSFLSVFPIALLGFFDNIPPVARSIIVLGVFAILVHVFLRMIFTSLRKISLTEYEKVVSRWKLHFKMLSAIGAFSIAGSWLLPWGAAREFLAVLLISAVYTIPFGLMAEVVNLRLRFDIFVYIEALFTRAEDVERILTDQEKRVGEMTEKVRETLLLLERIDKEENNVEAKMDRIYLREEIKKLHRCRRELYRMKNPDLEPTFFKPEETFLAYKFFHAAWVKYFALRELPALLNYLGRLEGSIKMIEDRYGLAKIDAPKEKKPAPAVKVSVDKRINVEKEKLKEALSMVYRAVILDVDGTLTDFVEGKVPEEVITRIAELIEQGVYVALASGRIARKENQVNLYADPSIDVERDLAIDIESVASRVREKVGNSDSLKYLLILEQNGAHAYNGFSRNDPRAEEYDLGSNPLDEEVIQKVYEELRGEYEEKLLYMMDKGYCATLRLKEEFVEKDLILELAGKVSEILAREGLEAEIHPADTGVIDIVTPEVEKANVFDILSSDIFGIEIPEERIAAIGDQGGPRANDRSILERKGGFCVGEYSSSESLQVSIPLAEGLRAAEGTRWVLDNLRFQTNITPEEKLLNEAVEYVRKNMKALDGDIEYSKELAEVLIKCPIEKVLVVGSGLLTLPAILSYMGRSVTFVDADRRSLSSTKRLMSLMEDKNGETLSIKFIEGKVGETDLEEKGLDPKTFDLVTMIDLAGGIQKGRPRKWLEKAKELLKPEGYLVADMTKEFYMDESIKDSLEDVFPVVNRLTHKKFKGTYEDETSKNMLFYVRSDAQAEEASLEKMQDDGPAREKEEAPQESLEEGEPSIKNLFDKLKMDMLSLLELSYNDYSTRLGEAVTSAMRLESEGESLILYADDILKSTSVSDLESTFRGIVKRENIFRGGKIFIYSRESSEYGEILESLINKAAPSLETVKITKEDLEKRRNITKGELDEIEALSRLAKQEGAREVLGIIRGPVEEPEKMKDLMTRHNIDIPIVIVGMERGLYSFAEAVKKAINKKASGGIGGWLIPLSPVRAWSEDIDLEYREFKRSLAALKAA